MRFVRRMLELAPSGAPGPGRCSECRKILDVVWFESVVEGVFLSHAECCGTLIVGGISEQWVSMRVFRRVVEDTRLALYRERFGGSRPADEVVERFIPMGGSE